MIVISPCPGLPVHLSADWGKQRPDEAGHPGDPQRPRQPKPRAHHPGTAVCCQHWQSRDGRGAVRRHPQTPRVRVGVLVVVKSNIIIADGQLT